MGQDRRKGALGPADMTVLAVVLLFAILFYFV